MKFFFIYILLLPFFCKAQVTIGLKLLQQMQMSTNTEEAQSKLSKVGFNISDTRKIGEDSECVEQYIFRREVTTTLSFSEVINLQRNCVHNTWFNSLRFMTRDQETFDRIKQDCIDNSNYIFVSDGIEDNFLFQKYKGEGWVFLFKTGKDQGVAAYIVEIFYQFP